MSGHRPPWGVCYKCGQPGHIANNCPLVRCYGCQQLGHVARNCPGPHSSQRRRSCRVTKPSPYQKRDVSHSQPHNFTRRVQGVRPCPQSVQTPHPQGSIQTTQGTSQPQGSIQTAQGTSQPQGSIQTTQGTSQPQTQEDLWLQAVLDWHPNLHNETYFLSPLHFNRVPYAVEMVNKVPALVPQVASDQPHQVSVNVPSGPPPQPDPRPLAAKVYQPVAPGDPLGPVYECDVRDDRAMQQIRQRLEQLVKARNEVMFVLSELQFGKYLYQQDQSVRATAARQQLPRPDTRGDFDILIISRRYGLIVGEVKSVGDNSQHLTDQAVLKAVKKAVKQLKKADATLRQLVSDMAPVKLTRILMLPNIKCQQLMAALITDPKTEKDLCQCLGAPDTAAAVARCLCADNSDDWWDRSVTDYGQDTNMTSQPYEQLVARFCGPATSIEVPTVTTPRRSVELRTLSEAIAHTGLRMAILTLYPQQVALLNDTQLQRVFLWGPPGTGKTVILTLKGMQWRHRGKDVHLLSSHKDSRAAILLIEGTVSIATSSGAAPRVHRHMYDFDNKGDVETAVQELAAAANGGELFIIMDECYHGSDSNNTTGRFSEFVTHLAARVPHLHLWAAAVDRVQVPDDVVVSRLTTPVRCPLAVVREVEKSGSVDDKKVLRYSSSATPAPTDGPAVREIHHETRNSSDVPRYILSPGHTEKVPVHCPQCADDVAHLLVNEIRVGQPGQDLQYRDVIILCHDPRDARHHVQVLRDRSVPVQVVTSRDDETAIRDVALATTNNVIITDWDVVSGLERRIVVVMGGASAGTIYVPNTRLRAMSRSTSLLVWVGRPL